MAILVQSFLNSAPRLTTTATTATTVAQLKTLVNAIEGVSTSIMEFYIINPSTTSTALVSGTLGSYGVTTATTIYSSNTISTATNKVDRQLAKLELAQLRRQAAGNPDATYYRTHNIYDVNLLADKYTGNTSTVGTTSTLVEARPWSIFLPTRLFAASEKGVWFDPSDITTLFQDSTGTLAVTAVGQPVGKMLDKSGNGYHATQSTAGKRPTYQIDPYGYGYLAFDGVDDFMVTGSIDFTGTATMTASVGLLVDPTKVTAGTAVVTGGDPTSVNGTFLIGAPSSTADHSFYLRGNSTIQARVPNQVVGDDILTGIFDISQSTKELELIPRLSGVVSTNISWTGTNAGTGNFGNQPLYVGSLGGTGVFFKGNMYGIVIRGKKSTANEILLTEAWINRNLD
jgi:hypothetical protein